MESGEGVRSVRAMCGIIGRLEFKMSGKHRQSGVINYQDFNFLAMNELSSFSWK